jgi:hypothetical protein
MATLSTLLSGLRDYLKSDPNDKIWSTSQKTNAINVAYFQLQKDGNFNWAENQDVATWTTTGIQEYPISTYVPNFIRMDLVQFSDTTGEIYPTTKAQQLRNANSGTGRPSSYYIWNNKIGFYPQPDLGYPVRILYRKKLAAITNSVDSSFSDEFNDAIIKYAAAQIWATTKNTDKARQALQEYQLDLNLLKMSYLFNDTAALTFPFQKQSAQSRRLKFDPKTLS